MSPSAPGFAIGTFVRVRLEDSLQLQLLRTKSCVALTEKIHHFFLFRSRIRQNPCLLFADLFYIARTWHPKAFIHAIHEALLERRVNEFAVVQGRPCGLCCRDAPGQVSASRLLVGHLCNSLDLLLGPMLNFNLGQ